VSGIGLDRERFAALRFNVIDDMRGSVCAPGISDRDASAVFGETLGDGGADTARGPRDEGDLVDQIGHGKIPFESCIDE
jgi:hypothetical protein